MACASALDTLKPAVDALKADVSNARARAALKLAMDVIKDTIDLIEATGDTVDGDAPCCPTKARPRKKKAAPIRGPIRTKMLNDLDSGTLTVEQLRELPDKELEFRYGAKRTTVVDARKEACRDWESRQIATNDKS